MQMVHRLAGSGTSLAAVFVCAASFASDPVDARCSTTDDGKYSCQFRTVDGSGSFEISAPGKPTYTLNITKPGVAKELDNSTDVVTKGVKDIGGITPWCKRMKPEFDALAAY